jgi:hypothetical protein
MFVALASAGAEPNILKYDVSNISQSQSVSMDKHPIKSDRVNGVNYFTVERNAEYLIFVRTLFMGYRVIHSKTISI